MADWPESDLDSGNALRVGTWNLDRSEPDWRRPHQAEHVANQADVWLLTEVPSGWRHGSSTSVFSALRPDEPDQHWAAITSRWQMEPIIAEHPALAMARINHRGGAFLAASSVFPWRGAVEFWPAADGDSFADRCAVTLAAHATAISRARGDLPVVWGGDFNQAMSGREYVGSREGRAALREAFIQLGLRAVTDDAAGQDPLQQSIDHIAVPLGWSSADVEVQRPQSDGRFLSDHPSYVVAVERKANGSKDTFL